jgi:hypothetical protein
MPLPRCRRLDGSGVFEFHARFSGKIVLNPGASPKGIEKGPDSN